MSNESSGHRGIFVLLALVAGAFGVQAFTTKDTAPPEASMAVMRYVMQERREATMGGHETDKGYVIDPALAKRMLADTGLSARISGVRGISDRVVVRADLSAPGDNGGANVVRYFSVQRPPSGDWTVLGTAKPMDWYIKLW
jgi:hypothetical protein